MTDAISVNDLVTKMDELEAKGEAARRKVQDATKEYQLIRTEVTVFKNKFGRVLQMMRED